MQHPSAGGEQMSSRRAPLSSVLKFKRATVHFQALKREIEDFFKPAPNPPVFDFEPDPKNLVVRVRIKKPLPLEWSPIIGDCIYNLRSGLDHLVWATILKHGGKPTARNEFPIFLDRDRYLEVDKRGKPTARSGLAKVEGLPNGAQTAIERVQPYNRADRPPDLHPLWLLHEISNEDKHRLVNVVLAAIQRGYVAIRGLGHGKIERYGLPIGALEDGAVVAHIQPMLGYELESKLDVKFNFTPGVTFSPEGPGRGLSVPDTLSRIHTFIVNELLPTLRPFIK